MMREGFLPCLNVKHSTNGMQGVPPRRVFLPRVSARRTSPTARAFVFAVGVFYASSALSGGLDDTATAPDPCVTVERPASMTDAMFAQWQAVRRMSCPDLEVERRAFFDRATGEQLTDDEILRRVFTGDRIEQPTPVPAPASLALLLAGLAGLWRLRK
jgi:hypothetical protein